MPHPPPLTYYHPGLPLARIPLQLSRSPILDVPSKYSSIAWPLAPALDYESATVLAVCGVGLSLTEAVLARVLSEACLWLVLGLFVFTVGLSPSRSSAPPWAWTEAGGGQEAPLQVRWPPVDGWPSCFQTYFFPLETKFHAPRASVVHTLTCVYKSLSRHLFSTLSGLFYLKWQWKKSLSRVWLFVTPWTVDGKFVLGLAENS